MTNIIASIVAGLALVMSMPAVASDLVGQARVVDGDTIEIHSVRIRLWGIDAPESSQTCLRGTQQERCGQVAANALADTIGRQTVHCVQRDTDRYGRVVAVCTAVGVDLNGWMVEQGHAVAYRQFSMAYVDAENRARSARLGIWGTRFEAPADYRRSHSR